MIFKKQRNPAEKQYHIFNKDFNFQSHEYRKEISYSVMNDIRKYCDCSLSADNLIHNDKEINPVAANEYLEEEKVMIKEEKSYSKQTILSKKKIDYSIFFEDYSYESEIEHKIRVKKDFQFVKQSELKKNIANQGDIFKIKQSFEEKSQLPPLQKVEKDDDSDLRSSTNELIDFQSYDLENLHSHLQNKFSSSFTKTINPCESKVNNMYDLITLIALPQWSCYLHKKNWTAFQQNDAKIPRKDALWKRVLRDIRDFYRILFRNRFSSYNFRSNEHQRKSYKFIPLLSHIIKIN